VGGGEEGGSGERWPKQCMHIWINEYTIKNYGIINLWLEYSVILKEWQRWGRNGQQKKWGTGRVTQVVEHLPSKNKTLNSNSSATKEKEGKRERERERERNWVHG
jgi:hypothetical protein